MQYADRLDLTGSQSPEQIGHAIAALADDLDLLNLTRRGAQHRCSGPAVRGRRMELIRQRRGHPSAPLSP
jgi:hypothetical protein